MAFGAVWLIGLANVVFSDLNKSWHLPRDLLIPTLVTTAAGLLGSAVHLMALGQQTRHVWGAVCLVVAGVALPSLMWWRARIVQRRLQERRVEAARRAERERRRRQRRPHAGR
ncbi:hypothetical protein ACH41E_34710 [Streptomyces sp. NPDC020412]|uniref:hypothetical protein n=1 Tax=Streptomyces sp. NPDC020412 TaxID=3365073 RepID=UPI0037B7C37E